MEGLLWAILSIGFFSMLALYGIKGVLHEILEELNDRWRPPTDHLDDDEP